jgi:hypothetical protein
MDSESVAMGWAVFPGPQETINIKKKDPEMKGKRIVFIIWLESIN